MLDGSGPAFLTQLLHDGTQESPGKRLVDKQFQRFVHETPGPAVAGRVRGLCRGEVEKGDHVFESGIFAQAGEFS
jgi:hypothetical protein